MSRMKDYLAIIHGGGDEAVEIAQQFMGLSDFTVQDEPSWIPVGERVPDGDKEQFLVASGDYIGVAWWHAGPQKFIHEDIDNAWTPTHWMPLPEPPAS